MYFVLIDCQKSTCFVFSASPLLPMVRLRTYGQVLALPGGRSFYSNPRKRARRLRAPITPALKAALGKQWEARRAEYTSALKDARNTVQRHATQLKETFGGHSTEYYTQEILQRGRLECGRRKPSKWNAYLHHEIKARNAGMKVLTSHTTVTQLNSQSYPPDSQNSSRTISPEKLLRHGMQWILK